MADPIGDMFRQFNQQTLEMNKIASQMAQQQMQMAINIMAAPMQLMASMVNGSGYYTQTLGTAWNRQHNVFGE